MSDFYHILIITSITGLLFAFGAYLTAFRAGKALEPGAEPSQAAFRIGYKDYSLSTGNALVGLIVVSVLCIIVVPMFIAYMNFRQHDAPIFLKAHFKPLVVPMSIVHDDEGQLREVNLKIFRTSTDQSFTVSVTPPYEPHSISAHYDPLNDTIIATVDGTAVYRVPVTGEQAEIPIVLPWVTEKPSNIAASASAIVIKAPTSKTKPVPKALHSIADPEQLR